MAKRNKDTAPEPAPFAVEDAVTDSSPTGQNDDDNDYSELDEMEFDAGPPPAGVQGVALMNAKAVKVDGGKRTILEFMLEGSEFEGVEPLQIWLTPNDRGDISRLKMIIAALGGRWCNTTNKPYGGWKTVMGKRGRAVVGVWEKTTEPRGQGELTGEVEFQISKYPPMFTDTDQGRGLRDAFQASCDASGIVCEFGQIEKGKHIGKWSAKGKLFNGCGILPV